MNVEGRIYGPYSTAQMAAFVLEKRLAYHSLVAPAGSRDFRPALQFTELRDLFKGGKTRAPGDPEAPRQPERQDTARVSTEPSGDPLLVIFGSEAAAERAVSQFGALAAALPLSATAFLLRSPKGADGVRDDLARTLPSTERALVFACAGQPASCHGVSLEEHDRIANILRGITARSFR
jgi:hypothetical protein